MKSDLEVLATKCAEISLSLCSLKEKSKRLEDQKSQLKAIIEQIPALHLDEAVKKSVQAGVEDAKQIVEDELRIIDNVVDAIIMPIVEVENLINAMF
jgi:hypothetical protein